MWTKIKWARKICFQQKRSLNKIKSVSIVWSGPYSCIKYREKRSQIMRLILAVGIGKDVRHRISVLLTCRMEESKSWVIRTHETWSYKIIRVIHLVGHMVPNPSRREIHFGKVEVRNVDIPSPKMSIWSRSYDVKRHVSIDLGNHVFMIWSFNHRAHRKFMKRKITTCLRINPIVTRWGHMESGAKINISAHSSSGWL